LDCEPTRLLGKEFFKGDEMGSEKPLYQRTWFIVVMSVLLLSIVAGSLGSSEPESQAPTPEPTVTVTATSSATPTPTPTASEESATAEPEGETASPSPIPSEDPDSAENIAYFLLSSNGQFRDLDKDVDDARKRAEADETIRLLGNILEFSFNLGQLRSLDPPSSIAEEWIEGIDKLDQAITKSSDAASDFITGSVSTSQMLKVLKGVQTRVDNLRKITASLD